MQSIVSEKKHWLMNFASILLITICFILYFNGTCRIKEWWKGRRNWVCLVILNILWKYLSCLLKKPIRFSRKSQMKYEFIQCIEKDSEIVAVYCNLTADIAIPTFNLGFCHGHRYGFGLEFINCFGNLQAIWLHCIMWFTVLELKSFTWIYKT